MVYEIQVDGFVFSLELSAGSSAGEWLCRVKEAKPRGSEKKSSASTGAREYRAHATSSGEGILSLLLNGKSYAFHRDPSGSLLVFNGRRYEIELRDPRSLRSRRAAAGGEEGPRKLVAPMPGKVVRMLASEGSEVEAGQGLLVVEAMKMQNELKSPKKGMVKKFLVREGAAVNAGDPLAIID